MAVRLVSLKEPALHMLMNLYDVLYTGHKARVTRTACS